MNRQLRIVSLFALGLAAAAPSHALFGIGKKKEKIEADKKSGDMQRLPGMPAPGEEGTPGAEGMPKMADEEKKQQAMREAMKEARDQMKGGRSDDGERASSGPPPSSMPAGSGLPTEVVIKGSGDNKLNSQKPPLRIDSDPFESIRASLKPDESLLLAESPLTITWRRTHPEFMLNGRVVEPWRTTFSERPGIAFYPREQLFEAVGRRLEQKETRAYQWQLTIADEEGRVFQHYEGSSNPPEELIWSGQNDQGEWIKAGRAYSPIYMFTDPGGSPHTKVGKTLQFTGVIHQEPDGLHISMDSSVLFGTTKGARDLEKGGTALVRSAADLIKRRFSGIPVRIQAFASGKELGDAQAKLVQDKMMAELMIPQNGINYEGASAPFSEQRIEVVLLNR
ncbi:MAG: hypothetical protein HY925_06300 [Elusimicrobia bacterium]|nr:hypothetical protein [Elusimicrobiota bacterium]